MRVTCSWLKNKWFSVKNKVFCKTIFLRFFFFKFFSNYLRSWDTGSYLEPFNSSVSSVQFYLINNYFFFFSRVFRDLFSRHTWTFLTSPHLKVTPSTLQIFLSLGLVVLFKSTLREYCLMAIVYKFISVPIFPVFGISVSMIWISQVSRRLCGLGNSWNWSPIMRSPRGFRPIRKFGKKGAFWRWWESVFLSRCPRHFPTSIYLSQFIKSSEFKLPNYFFKFRSESMIGTIQLLGQWYFVSS